MSAEPVIRIDGLVKDYRALRPLRLAQLSISPGERVALSGFDATAAEVLVNLVNGAILPDQGDVSVFGQSTRAIGNEDEWFASLDRFGIVTPRAVLLEASTVAQNLALPVTIELDALDADVRARVEAIAAEVEIPRDALETAVSTQSPGTRMRIHLARALVMNPQVLLLEHPTVPLAREDVGGFAELTRRAATSRNLTVLAITEDAEFAAAVATAHYRVHGGTGALTNARGWRRWW